MDLAVSLGVGRVLYWATQVLEERKSAPTHSVKSTEISA